MYQKILAKTEDRNEDNHEKNSRDNFDTEYERYVQEC